MSNCPDEQLCQRLKHHIHGRLWEIWQGINISPDKALAYRNKWLTDAGLSPEKSAVQPKGCGCKAK